MEESDAPEPCYVPTFRASAKVGVTSWLAQLSRQNALRGEYSAFSMDQLDRFKFQHQALQGPSEVCLRSAKREREPHLTGV